MITIIALVLQVLMTLITPADNVEVVVIPPAVVNESEWEAYHTEAYEEYADEFTALFNSYEIKRAKNGALMIRRGNSGSFKFAKKG